MAKFLGVLAGAALAAVNYTPVDAARVGGQVRRLAHDYWDGDAAQNDTVSLGNVDWETLIDGHSIVDFDDFGTSVTLDIGDVTYPAALVDGQDVAAAAGQVALLKSVAIENRRQPLWKMLGYATLADAKAVGARCELLASFKDANPDSGTLAWTIYGSPQ